MAPPSKPIFENVVTYKPDFSKIARSPIINFVVGINKFPMAIHAAAVQGLSLKLNAMVNDSLMADTAFSVPLRDVRVEVFRVFIEFAYSGDYHRVANGDLSTNQLKRKPDEANLSQENTPRKKQQDKSEDSKRIVSTNALRTSRKSLSSVSPSLNTERELSSNHNNHTTPDFVNLISSMEERFKSMNYSHNASGKTPHLWILVGLYAFATQYSIEALRQRSLSSIHGRLCSYNSRAQPDQVVNAIKIMYSKVSKDESGLLRDLCMRYAACRAAYLYKTEEFEGLLRSNQGFVIDFVRALGD